MLDKFNFELELEKIAEKFYFNGPLSLGQVRGGNSSGNEVYFRLIGEKLKESLECQQLILAGQKCPDSGIFGDFNYKVFEDVDWEATEKGSVVVLEVTISNDEKRFIEFKSDNLPTDRSEFFEKRIFDLNKIGMYGELFGVEFKASKNKSAKSIGVASFNSTCPSGSKVTTLNKVKLIHNLQFGERKKFQTEKSLFVDQFQVQILFSMYYFIVNDTPEKKNSKINYIFLCHGSFFAPGISPEIAAKLSKQLMPHDLKMDFKLERVKLRYRAFFEAPTIKTKGFGLYTSWKPKIQGLIREEKEREALLKEVLEVPQDFKVDETDQESVSNVIYLNLTDARIRKRCA